MASLAVLQGGGEGPHKGLQWLAVAATELE